MYLETSMYSECISEKITLIIIGKFFCLFFCFFFGGGGGIPKAWSTIGIELLFLTTISDEGAAIFIFAATADL